MLGLSPEKIDEIIGKLQEKIKAGETQIDSDTMRSLLGDTMVEEYTKAAERSKMLGEKSIQMASKENTLWDNLADDQGLFLLISFYLRQIRDFKGDALAFAQLNQTIFDGIVAAVLAALEDGGHLNEYQDGE